MTIVLLSERDFETLWTKSAPVNRLTLDGLPATHMMLWPQNTLVMVQGQVSMKVPMYNEEFTLANFYLWLAGQDE